MEKLKLKYEQLCNALNKFEIATEHLDKLQRSEGPQFKDYFEEKVCYEAARDSLIQRFEFTIELFWKYLKRYLSEVKRVIPENNTPRDVIRKGCLSGIIAEDDSEKFLNMLDQRNETSHRYGEEIADRSANQISNHFFPIIKQYIDKLEP